MWLVFKYVSPEYDDEDRELVVFGLYRTEQEAMARCQEQRLDVCNRVKIGIGDYHMTL